MTITPVGFTPFAGSIGDLTHITPFTHRDNATFLTIMKGIIDYLNKQMNPEIEAELQRIIDEFNALRGSDEERYDEFVGSINALVSAINNRVGPESMNRVGLVSDYTLNIDPTWPDAHPVRFQFTQDGTGFHNVIYGAGITGVAAVDPTPGVMTEIELVPDGAGNWLTRVLNRPEAINVAKEFGCHPGGVFDNTAKLNAVMDEARATSREVFIPAGEWYVAGEVNISGVTIRGVVHGYQNQNGTILQGSGGNLIFNQQDVAPLDRVRCGVHGIRFENCATALRVSYSVYSHFTDLWAMDTTADAIICGDVSIIGPLWNMFDRVTGISTAGYGLRLAGLNWCNSNVFDTCFFKGTTGAVNVLSASGFGSLDNKFHNTEIVSAVGPGIVFNGTNRSTTLEKCFIEPHGPAIVVNNPTADLQLIGNVYGSVRNNIVGYGPNFIDHKASTLSVRILGGWITTNAIPEQVDLRFIGSANVAGLVLEYLAEPSLVGIASTGFKLHDESVISAAQRVHRGDVLVKTYNQPKIELSYADGSKLFTIKRNGTQGGSDFGVTFTNDGTLAMTIVSNGMVIHNGHFGTAKATAAATPGALAYKLPVYDASQAQIGFIQIYTGTV